MVTWSEISDQNHTLIFQKSWLYFLFLLKSLFVLKVFKFLPDFFDYVRKRLDKKAKVNFKIYYVTDWIKNIPIDILSSIVRSKGNQKMKFGHLIEYNMGSIFLEKLYAKCSAEASLRYYYKNLKLNIFEDQCSEIL